MNEVQKTTLMQFFKAVGQLERLKTLGLLANRAYTIPELANILGLKETAVSRTISTLQKAKLVEGVSNAQPPQFQLNKAGLTKMQHIVEEGTAGETFAERVMKQYVQNETLKAIPHDEEERELILNWLTEKFDLQKRYTESEVTEIVANYYPYPLTLRRLLADNQFLMHTGRHYWRPLPNRQ